MLPERRGKKFKVYKPNTRNIHISDFSKAKTAEELKTMKSYQIFSWKNDYIKINLRDGVKD